jgi:hypothetical protein
MNKHELAKRVSQLNQDAVSALEARALGAGRRRRLKASGLSGGNFFDDVIGTVGSVGKAVSPFLPLLALGKKKKAKGRSGGAMLNMKNPFAPKVMYAMGKARAKKGSGWFSDLMDGVSTVAQTASHVIPVVKAVRGKGRCGGQSCMSGVKVYKKRGRGMSAGQKVDGRMKRAMIVKKVMKEHGLSLIEASKYVKKHKLY